ncbi:universal stress protein [Nocardioides sp.]|uniref:universal stress protein n=1 Tax=Nocardioides sp. TaxID=35761 RepID=UPI001A2AE89C|nr:universal stress protein [Nocardioides sp.]MBJ7356642.1 universal stress protein [Nocardioides sp.]
MWDSDPPKVLVGVDPHGCEAALQYAVPEAIRRGTGLHLLHVERPVGWWSCVPDDLRLDEHDLRRAAQRLLGETAARAKALVGDLGTDPEEVGVSSELSHGSAVAALESLSGHACVMVLQHHGAGPRGDTPTMSVTAGAAAVSHCPVAAVPDRWRPDREAAGVLAAVEDPVRDRVVAEVALQEATRRGVGLQVVQAVRDDPPPSLFPVVGLDVEVLVRGAAHAAEVLAERAEGSCLVVVGRHHRGSDAGAPLGATVRELLRRCQVPMLVVDATSG